MRAQDETTAEHSKITTNLGGGVTAPVNPTARLVGPSGNAVIGIGYNLTRRNSLIGQFMWAGLPANRDAFRPIWLVAGTRNISGSSNLFTITGNYRYRREGKVFGVYFIGGGGMYHRQATLSRTIPVGEGVVCSPAWQYWGFGCVNGIVSTDQTLISAGSTVFGGNGGVGFTIRINDEGYKFYVEARYHYAPTRNISTQLIPITLGFSW
jgi:hypothetical protein